MFSLFKKKPNHSDTTITLHIDGMHCTSCSLNIDNSLEDVDGVIEAETSYSKSKTVVTFNPAKVKTDDLIKAVKKCGYTAKAL